MHISRVKGDEHGFLNFHLVNNAAAAANKGASKANLSMNNLAPIGAHYTLCVKKCDTQSDIRMQKNLADIQVKKHALS